MGTYLYSEFFFFNIYTRCIRDVYYMEKDFLKLTIRRLKFISKLTIYNLY